MKRLLPTVGAALLAMALVVQADAPDELYVTYYNMLQDAETLQSKGDEAAALVRYREVQDGLKKLQSAYPGYNSTVIQFRLEYVTKKIDPLAKKFPDIKPVPSVSTPASKSAAAPKMKGLPTPPPEPVFTDTEITRLNDRIISLQTEKIMLQKQLKDALAAKPAAVDPKELAKAEGQIQGLQKERDLLKVSLQQEQERAAKLIDPKEANEAKKQLVEDNKQMADLQKSIDRLTADKSSLEKKITNMRESRELPQLKEENASLKKQVSEMSKLSGQASKLQDEKATLESKLAALSKENDSLKSANKKVADMAKLETANAALELKVKSLKSENDSLTKAAKKAGDVTKLESEVKSLKSANSSLEDQLKDAQKKASRMASTSDADATLKKELAETQRKLADQQKMASQASSYQQQASASAAQLKAQEELIAKLRHDNQKMEELLTDPAALPSGKPSAIGSTDEVATLKAELKVLEAKKVPYSKEELALFKAPATPAPVEATTKAGGENDLPASAKPLLVDAQRAFAEKRFSEAAEKYEEILKLSSNNVFVLANLAAIQLEQDKLSAAEKNLSKAISLKDDDAYSLSLMGILKFREEKYDEALKLLSRSAELDPKDSETQNFLGITLSQKGQRVAAEAALRKAIELSPGNANAHHNLAVIYATQNPPMLELARWHYEKALSYGHPKNPDLEKLFSK